MIQVISQLHVNAKLYKHQLPYSKYFAPTIDACLLKTKTSTITMPLLSIPNELLLLIAQYLNPKDLNSFIQTNRHLSFLLANMLHRLAVQDKIGLAALLWAASKGHEPLVRLVLEQGARVDERDGEGHTALHRAASEGHENIVRLLLEKGADLYARTNDESTVLHWAVSSRSDTVARLVLMSGLRAEINFQSFEGADDSHLYRGTALHWAAIGGYEAMAKILLEEGADTSLRDNTGKTALIWAADFGHEAVCRVLLEKGADIDARDEYGFTALDRATSGGSKEIANLLKLG